MNRHYLVLLFVIFTGCAQQPAENTQPLNLQTTAPSNQITNLARDIQEWHNLQHPDCPYVKVISAQVIERKPKMALEHWTIEACKKQQFTYSLEIFPQPGGGIGDSVFNVDISPVKSSKP